MLRGLISAIHTLSVLRLPVREADQRSSALSWFAVVGGVLGLMLYGISLLVDWLTDNSWPGGTALAVLIAGILLTGGLHLDGLADWADTLGSISNRERRLEIMKDPHVGAFGVLVIAVVLLSKWVALARLAEFDMLVWILAACVVSRTMMVDLAVRLPYARREGGTGASFVENARPGHLLASTLWGLALVVVSCGPLGVIAVGLGGTISRAFGLWCRHRIGGVTGDVIGAGSEIVETLVLLAAALTCGLLDDYMYWRSVMDIWRS